MPPLFNQTPFLSEKECCGAVQCSAIVEKICMENLLQFTDVQKYVWELKINRFCLSAGYIKET
jgi:hypothetical protein